MQNVKDLLTEHVILYSFVIPKDAFRSFQEKSVKYKLLITNSIEAKRSHL